MKRRNNIRGWLCTSVAIATIFLSGSLAAETKKPPKVFKVFPEAVYADENHFKYPLYPVTVFGENFPDNANLRIYLDDREARLTLAAPPKKPTNPPPGRKDEPQKTRDEGEEIYVQRDGSSQLKLWINKNHYSGTLDLRVGSANSNDEPALLSEERPSVTLARANPGALFKAGALLLAIMILMVPVWMIRASGASYKVPNNPHWIVAALFLDKETATYSLSKFQFYIWTAVSVFGYIYLFSARGLVQGVWSFIDIPGSLPGMVGISAFTGVAAQLVTTQRGPKGAGEEHPSYADFVSSGGVVVAERFQFLIWTIIGASAFFWLVISQDPLTITSLPKVPEGFLQLMGISSLGYLAGKLARSPGPVVDDIIATVKDTQSLVMTLRGRILSKNATFKISYKGALQDSAPNAWGEAPLTGDLDPQILERDEQSVDTAKKIQITIQNYDVRWLQGDSKLVISNPDGQSASWPFAGPPEIKTIAAEGSADSKSLKLTFEGVNLAQSAAFSIDGVDLITDQLPPGATKIIVPHEVWQPPRYAKKLELTISKPVDKWITGTHKLKMVNPDGQFAEKDYTIDGKPATPPAPAPSAPRAAAPASPAPVIKPPGA